MFKKFAARLFIGLILSTLLTFTASAAQGDYITNLTATPTPFDPNNTDYVTVSFDLSQQVNIDANVRDSGQQIVATLDNGTAHNPGSISYTWYGRENNSPTGNLLPDGTYTIKVSAMGGDDYSSVTVNINAQPVNNLSLVSLSPAQDATYEPINTSGSEQPLTLSYELSQEPDSISIKIENPYEDEVNNCSFSAVSGSCTWDGKYANDYAIPGTYRVTLTAAKSGFSDLIVTRTFDVEYNHSSKPGISDFNIDPATFDPDDELAVIEFTNDDSAYLTVELRNSNDGRILTFDDYNDEEYNANDDHSIVWDGEDSNNNDVSNGTYKVNVIARNDYGVTFAQEQITVDDSGSSISSSNAHISGISLSPSSKFEPAEDDELEIEFDVEQDLDDLVIYAVRGSTEVEIDDLGDTEEENNLEATWDGTDDDGDYVDDGPWRIEFRSEKDSDRLTAAKTIEVEYEKPGIDDLYISKDEFDNDEDEFIYILFRVDTDAEVDIILLEDGDEEDEIEEEMEVEEDVWYAVEWDGGNYDYDDDLDIKLIARNTLNENVYDTETESIDLDEDDVSSNKSNILRDSISPVVTDGNDQMEIYYDLEDDADVEISIHRGKTSSGSTVIELLDIEDQESGDHTVYWNGLDDDGDKLSDGFYTYKITSKKSSSETETGLFIVGDVGDVDDGGSSGSSGSSGDGIAPGVIVDGQVSSGDDDDYVSGNCSGFSDVSANSFYCDAIEWNNQQGIFVGYGDGTFKPYQAINRVEVLKVILEAMDIAVSGSSSGTEGFIDVQSGAWYMPYIKTAKALGVFHGDAGANTARPDDTVNRVEVLKFIFETLEIAKGVTANTCSLGYQDVYSGSWYYNYVCGSQAYNLFEISGSYFTPSSLSTRGEVALALYRLHLGGLL